METTILRELIALSIATTALTTLLGLLNQGVVGGLFLGVPAGIACSLCWGGFKLYGRIGLLIGILLAAFLGYFLGRMFGKRRGGLFVAFLWLGYCAACAVGYWAAGWVGWLTITLPSMVLFWYSLWRFSGRLLPLQIQRRPRWLRRYLLRRLFAPHQIDNQVQRERHYRYQSFRALLTYSSGTNYPYYVVKGGKRETRVDGNPYGQFFAGPGIVITEPHQAAVITDGMEVKEIAAPGLAFTGLFDRVDQIVDLRPQLKAFYVEAFTEDGIRIRVLAFAFFKIRAHPQQQGRFWVDGESDQAILQVMRAQPVEEAERRDWDDLVPMTARRILQDIISQYRCNELCAGDQPDWLPHGEIPWEVIRREFAAQLTNAMAAKCEAIQILGAGIANLEPVERGVMQRRIENWRTEWTRKMMIQMGRGETEAMRLISQARAQGQAEVIRILSKEAEDMDTVDKDILADVLTLRLLEALESMARRPPVQQLLPAEATETMKYLRRAIGEGSSAKVQEPGG